MLCIHAREVREHGSAFVWSHQKTNAQLHVGSGHHRAVDVARVELAAGGEVDDAQRDGRAAVGDDRVEAAGGRIVARLPQIGVAIVESDNPSFVTTAGRIPAVRSAVADITILAPDLRVRVDARALRSRSKNTPFDGWELRGGVAATIVGGRTLFVNAQTDLKMKI